MFFDPCAKHLRDLGALTDAESGQKRLAQAAGQQRSRIALPQRRQRRECFGIREVPHVGGHTLFTAGGRGFGRQQFGQVL